MALQREKQNQPFQRSSEASVKIGFERRGLPARQGRQQSFEPATQRANQARGTLGSLSETQPKNLATTPAGPMIVRTAELTLVSKEFDAAREALERIVHHHQGYTAQLSVSGQAGAGQVLTATLRVPAEQLDTVLAELKKLGRAEQESQGDEEVTQQYVDLSARLSNARNTEQRLIGILRQRTGRMTDILAVERESARVRGEIETMDAQLKNLEKHVYYATLQVKLSEEYKAQLEVTPPSVGTRVHNAFIEGYRGVADSAAPPCSAIP